MHIVETATKLGLSVAEIKELLDVFIDTTLDDLQGLEHSLKEKNGEALATHAHSIKGAAGSLELTPISSLAAEIEVQAHKGKVTGVDSLLVQLKDQVAELAQALGKTPQPPKQQ